MKSHPLAFFALALALPTSAHAYNPYAKADRDNFVNGMSLAVQLFNPDHAKALKTWGPEHTFMTDLLYQFDALRPDLTQLGRTRATSTGNTYVGATSPRPYYDIAYKYTDKYGDDVKDAELDQVEASLIALFPNSQRNIQTTEDYMLVDGKEKVWDIKKVTSLKFDDKASPLAKVLKQYDISAVSIVKNGHGSSSKNVYMVLQGGSPQDMGYVLTQVKRIPEFAPFADRFTVSDEDGDLVAYRKKSIQEVGGNMEIAAVPGQKDVYTLKVSIGWCALDDGDCWGRAKYKHDWNYEVTAKPAKPGEGLGNLKTGFRSIKTHFDFKLVSEKGPAPLPQSERKFWDMI
ncbi:MAG: hypothetical protein JST04_03020 [Bdellovibrionales bacterium]|nr:hypothetical protein [Bdellovibrionales bacterium]